VTMRELPRYFVHSRHHLEYFCRDFGLKGYARPRHPVRHLNKNFINFQRLPCLAQVLGLLDFGAIRGRLGSGKAELRKDQ
jgi:hypothetical protein